MRNKFAGTCYKCGLPVPAGAGYFEKVQSKDRAPGGPRWRTQHCYRTHKGGITCEMAQAAAIPKSEEPRAAAHS